MRKICVAVGSRANYSSIKSALRAFESHPDIELQVVLFASAVLDRFGSLQSKLVQDGFCVSERIFCLLEGGSLLTMAKSTGLALVEMASVLERLRPNIVVTVGDRFETMATAIASSYMNIPLAHTMGGEVSGTIDENVRHAVTKFANIHFPSNNDAANRLKLLGEDSNSIFNVGCPRIDLVREILECGERIDEDALFSLGVGDRFSLDKGFILVSQHPVTTEYEDTKIQLRETLKALELIGLPAIVLWPNADAGSQEISAVYRAYREKENRGFKAHFFKNLSIDLYVKLLNSCLCLVGNSSSGIREGAYIGVPVVNIGSRQARRERASNVFDVGYDALEIATAVNKQISMGKYPSSVIYGNGDSGKKIAEILANCDLNILKRITY